MGSKLKTFVNDKDTGGANVEVSLNDGDRIRIGTITSVMR